MKGVNYLGDGDEHKRYIRKANWTIRRGGRAVECIGLENRQQGNLFAGSNPAPSAFPTVLHPTATVLEPFPTVPQPTQTVLERAALGSQLLTSRFDRRREKLRFSAGAMRQRAKSGELRGADRCLHARAGRRTPRLARSDGRRAKPRARAVGSKPISRGPCGHNL